MTNFRFENHENPVASHWVTNQFAKELKASTDTFFADHPRSVGVNESFNVAAVCNDISDLFRLSTLLKTVTTTHDKRKFKVAIVLPAVAAIDQFISKREHILTEIHEPWKAIPTVRELVEKSSHKELKMILAFYDLITERNGHVKVTCTFYDTIPEMALSALAKSFHMLLRIAFIKIGANWTQERAIMCDLAIRLLATNGTLLVPWGTEEGCELDKRMESQLTEYQKSIVMFGNTGVKFLTSDGVREMTDDEVEKYEQARKQRHEKERIAYWSRRREIVRDQGYDALYDLSLWGSDETMPCQDLVMYLENLCPPIDNEAYPDEDRQLWLKPCVTYTPDNFPSYELLDTARNTKFDRPAFTYLNKGGYIWLRNHYMGSPVPERSSDGYYNQIPEGLNWAETYIGKATDYESGGLEREYDDEESMDIRIKHMFTRDNYPSYERIQKLAQGAANCVAQINTDQYGAVKELYMNTRIFPYNYPTSDKPFVILGCKDWIEFKVLMAIKYLNIERAQNARKRKLERRTPDSTFWNTHVYLEGKAIAKSAQD